MDVGRRDRIALWALSALCLLLGILLAMSLIGSLTAHPRRGAERSDQRPSPDPSTSAPSDPETPSPTDTPAPDQGHGAGGGTGGGGFGGGGTGSGGGSVEQPGASYTIAGTLTQQLRPGDVDALDLQLTNLGSAAMTALDLHVAISHVTAPAATASRPCTVNDFEVVQAAAGLTVDLSAYESTSLSARGIPTSQWPQIGMLNTTANQDGCKGATLTLSFSGSSSVIT
jgi:hypothetical protein